MAAGGTPLPPSLAADVSFVPTLLISNDGGATPFRGIRARFPNGNPETTLWPEGWVPSSAGAYVPAPKPDLNSTTVTHVAVNSYPGGMFSDFYWGEGGPCERLTPDSSYWCQPYGRVNGDSYFVRTPLGYTPAPATLPNAPYATNLTAGGAVFNYWRSGNWFSMMARVAGYNASGDGTITFGHGQFQGAEGENTGADWFIEHVLEELDAPTEFYLDIANQKLYFYHNATPGTPPPQGWTFEIPLLPVLINISGAQGVGTAVADVSISGITFTGSAPTFLAPHGVPSGGDWGLERFGSIFAEGSERLSISDCTFSRIDGNAVFLSGYSRNASIARNEFVWLGGSGVASWGRTANNGPDATDGNQPYGTAITDNICHEIGHYEKQSSCYFSGVSALANVSGNIFYNGPRAHININDGHGGGNVITRNMLWNSCRESQDHGPINSWDRVPYITTVRNGTASAVPQYNIIGPANFIVAGGGANGGSVDNDDGSSYYWIHDNFFVYGGMKSDFDGHGEHSVGNLMAYANVYGPHCMTTMQTPYYGDQGLPYANGYANNTCVLASVSGATYLSLGQRCVRDNSTGTLALWLGGNTVYAQGGAAGAMVECNGSLTMEQWLSQYGAALDPGSVAHDSSSLTGAQIVAWGAEKLGLA